MSATPGPEKQSQADVKTGVTGKGDLGDRLLGSAGESDFVTVLAKEGAKAMVKGLGGKFGGAIGGALGNALMGALGLAGGDDEAQNKKLDRIDDQLGQIKQELAQIQRQISDLSHLVQDLADYEAWLTKDGPVEEHVVAIQSLWDTMIAQGRLRKNCDPTVVDRWASDVIASPAAAQIHNAMLGTDGAGDALMTLWSTVLADAVKNVKFKLNFSGNPGNTLNYLIAFDYYTRYFARLAGAQLQAAVMLKCAFGHKAITNWDEDNPGVSDGDVAQGNKAFDTYLGAIQELEAPFFTALRTILEAYASTTAAKGFIDYDGADNYYLCLERLFLCPPELLTVKFDWRDWRGQGPGSPNAGYNLEDAERTFATFLPRRPNDPGTGAFGRVVVHQVEFSPWSYAEPPRFVTPSLEPATEPDPALELLAGRFPLFDHDGVLSFAQQPTDTQNTLTRVVRRVYWTGPGHVRLVDPGLSYCDCGSEGAYLSPDYVEAFVSAGIELDRDNSLGIMRILPYADWF